MNICRMFKAWVKDSEEMEILIKYNYWFYNVIVFFRIFAMDVLCSWPKSESVKQLQEQM